MSSTINLKKMNVSCNFYHKSAVHRNRVEFKLCFNDDQRGNLQECHMFGVCCVDRGPMASIRGKQQTSLSEYTENYRSYKEALREGNK